MYIDLRMFCTRKQDIMSKKIIFLRVLQMYICSLLANKCLKHTSKHHFMPVTLQANL